MTSQEKEFIKKNYQALSPAQMAKQLRRTEEVIRMWMIDILKVSPDEDVTQFDIDQRTLQKELVNSLDWEALKAEFMTDELKYFKYRYGKIMAQFHKDEVLPTEETQIFMLIKYEILMQRNLKDSKRSVEDVERLDQMLQDTYAKYDSHKDMDDNVKNFVLNLENQLLSARTAKQAKSTEYVKLTEKHSSLMKELKATRDQRINKLESVKETFLDILKELQHEEVRQREGRHMGLVDLAVQKERDRLAQLHSYSDGGLDQPLLTPETVGK